MNIPCQTLFGFFRQYLQYMTYVLKQNFKKQVKMTSYFLLELLWVSVSGSTSRT